MGQGGFPRLKFVTVSEGVIAGCTGHIVEFARCSMSVDEEGVHVSKAYSTMSPFPATGRRPCRATQTYKLLLVSFCHCAAF